MSRGPLSARLCSTLAGALVVLATGAVGVSLSIRWADQRMRGDLLRQTQMLAQAQNGERIRALTGTAADLQSPHYQRLKRQFAAVKQADDRLRFLYLMGRRPDGVVFFHVDNEPPDSKDYSPPGQTYDEATEWVRRVFVDWIPVVEGPHTDRWGTWLTALAPIHDPQMVRRDVATAEDAEAMVRQAVEFYRANGRERLLKAVSDPRGRFCRRDLYAFVYRLDMTMLAHPVKPEMIGKNQIDQKDWSGGKYFRREMRDLALGAGSGWVEYEYENPINKRREPKRAFLQRVDDLIIAAGHYQATGGVRVVLGMDVDARAWRRALLRAAAPPALFALLLAGTLFGGGALLRWRAGLGERAPAWTQRLEGWTVAAAGAALTLAVAWLLHQHEAETRRKAFAQLAAGRTEVVARTLRELREAGLESLARFYEGSDEVTVDEFRQFTAYLTEIEATLVWGWSEAVPAAEQAAFVAATRAAGRADFEIWEGDAPEDRRPSPARDIYYPIVRAAPLSANEQAFGYELGATPQRRALLAEAERTGLTTALAGQWPTGRGSGRALLVVRPVFHGGAPRRLRGFAFAALRADALLQAPELGGADLLELSLLCPDGPPESLAVSWDADSPPRAGLTLTRMVFAFGRVIAVTAHATSAFLRLHPFREGWLALLTGLGLSLAAALLTQVVFRGRAELERLVRERTAALRESEEKHRILLEESSDPIFAFTPAGQYTYVNRAFAAGVKRSASEIVGRTIWDVFPKEEADQRFAGLSTVFRTGEEKVIEVLVPHSDRWFLTTINPIKNPAGEVVSAICSSKDITDRKRAEEERARLHDRLEQATKMEAVGRLAGGVAHDFNNLLTGIIGHVSLALTQLGPDEPLRESLVEVNRAAVSAADLTRQLLTFSRKQLVEPRVLDLNEIIRRLEKMLARLIGEDIELRVALDEGLGRVKADPGQIEQILVNLVVNARDALPGGGKITLATANAELDAAYGERHADARPGAYVRLAVSDNGLGMTDEVKAHIFEPFFTTKAQGKGTGLGLSTVYGAVTQNEGCVAVYSEVGRGTTFKVYLPRVEAAAAAPGRDFKNDAPAGSETVVVVEDEEIVRALAEKALSRLGYKVHAYPNGGEALAGIQALTEPLHLLLTDVVMPGMSGKALADLVRVIRPDIKVLFTSGYTEDAIAHHGVLDEGIEFIGKPYTPLALAQKVREVLDK